jgi:hypothetical protein
MNQSQTEQTNQEILRLTKLMHSRSILHHLIYSMEHDMNYCHEQAKIALLKVELSALDLKIRQPKSDLQNNIVKTAH